MKTKRIYFVLLAMLLIVLTIAFVACTDPNATTDEQETTVVDGQKEIAEADQNNPVSNGAFSAAYNSTTGKYVKNGTITGWTSRTGSALYETTDSSNNKSTVATTTFSIVQGVVDLAKWSDSINGAIYGSQQLDKTNTFGAKVVNNNPNNYSTDTNALMIASDLSDTTRTYRSSAYYYSNSVTLEQGGYYRLSIDVLTLLLDDNNNIVTAPTDDLNENQGAYIVITDSSSNTYVYNRVDAINTYGQWKTITVDIKANTEADSTIGIQLWMGHGTSYVQSGTENQRLTAGVCLFDNVVVEKQTDATSYNTALTSVRAKVQEGNSSANTAYDSTKTQHVIDLADFGTLEKYGVYSYSSQSSTSTSYNYYYTARVGNPSSYSVLKGVEDSSNYTSSELPFYSTNSYLPYGIFDYSKVWSYADGTYTDTYFEKNSTEWQAFPYSDFYTNGKFDNNALKAFDNAYYETLKDTNALTIYNYKPSGVGYKTSSTYTVEQNGYYNLSVYAYAWQGLKIKASTNTSLSKSEMEGYLEKIITFNENINKYSAKASLRDVTATTPTKNFVLEDYSDELSQYITSYKTKVLNATDVSDEIKGYWTAYTSTSAFPTEWKYYYTESSSKYNFALSSVGYPEFSAGNWTKVEFNIKGNALGTREMGVEFWLGEGLSGSDTLSSGGLMISDVVMTKQDAAVSGVSYDQLSSFDASADYDLFGLVGAKKGDTIDSYGFTLEYAEGLYNESSVLSSITEDGIVLDEETNKKFNAINLNHTDYSASILTFAKTGSDNNVAVINPNKYYRLSVSVKTNADNYSKGTLQIISWNEASEQKKGSYNVLKSVSSIESNDKWTEYVFYISGAQQANKVALQFLFGSGDAYSPSTHAKGTVSFSGVTFVEVSYTEYSSENKGENISSYSFSYDYSTTNYLTNGRFTDVNYDKTVDDNKKDNREAYDAEGNLVGIGTPNTGWTKVEATYKNTLSKPSISFNDFEAVTKTTVATSLVSHASGVDTVDVTTLVQSSPAILYYGNGSTKYVATGETSVTITNTTDSAYTYQSSRAVTYDVSGTFPTEYENYRVSDGSTTVYVPDLKTRETLEIKWTNKQTDIATAADDYYEYEVWFVEKGKNSTEKYFVTSTDTTGTTISKVFDTTALSTTYRYQVPSYVSGTYYVRAVPKQDKVSSYYPSDYASLEVRSLDYVIGTDQLLTEKSDIIKEYTLNRTLSATELAKPVEGTKIYKGGNTYKGIVNYEKFDSAIFNGTSLEGKFVNIYPVEGENGYVRPQTEKDNGVWSYGYKTSTYRTINEKYNNLLMLASDVDTITGYTSSNKSLSAGTNYIVSFWVKTLEGAKASITLSNESGIFNGDFAGFNGISTDGNWVQYRIIIKVGFTDSKVKFGLYLGNPEGNKEYSSGIVLFDDISVRELTDDEYTDYTTAKEDKTLTSYEKDATAHNSYDATAQTVRYSNDFVYVALDYVTDSFDINNDDASGVLGATGGDFSQKMDSGDTNIDSSNTARAYGIYAQKNMTTASNYDSYISSDATTYEDTDLRAQSFYKEAGITSLDNLRSYLTGFGDNVMVLANFKANAQYIQSTSKSLENDKYYEISFYAKALTAEGKYAEFRIYESSSSTNYSSVRISGSGDKATDNGFKEYKMYIKNTSGSTLSSVMRFALGSGTIDENGNSSLIMGLLVIDKVTVTELENEDAYNAIVDTLKSSKESDKEAYLSGQQGYFEVETTSEDTDTETDTDEEEDKDTSWGSEEWLILSSAVIGFLIVATVIIYMIKVFKKKYTKKAKPENNLNLETKDKDAVQVKQQAKENNVGSNKDRSEFED